MNGLSAAPRRLGFLVPLLLSSLEVLACPFFPL
jgi:hypothetical protein